MKGLIIYATCYGSTKQYADWIIEETGYEAKSYKDVTDEELSAYDKIVIGSWVLANKLFLSKWIEEKKELLKNKEVVFYSVSGADPNDKSIAKVFKDSIDEKLYENAKCYRFGGRRETKKMSGFHKFMMFIATTFIEKDKDKKEEMKRYTDNVYRAYINPLIEQIK